MATALSRSFQNLRVARRYLHSLCRSVAATRSPPRHESSALRTTVMSHGRGLGGYYGEMYGRYLFSTTADVRNSGNPATKSPTATIDTASASTTSDATTSGGEERAGGSHQSGEAGKPVRACFMVELSFAGFYWIGNHSLL